MANIPPFSTFYAKTYTAVSDDAFRIEDNPNIVLKSMNVHVYTNDAFYGNSLIQPGIIVATGGIWFEANMRPFDLVFKNVNAGQNAVIVIEGPLA